LHKLHNAASLGGNTADGAKEDESGELAREHADKVDAFHEWVLAKIKTMGLRGT
jgi:hypothetical protein